MPDNLRARILDVESEVDAGRYKPGPWAKILDELRNRPDEERAALADDLTRTSDKLHLRNNPKRIGLTAAIGLELIATAIGGVLLARGLGNRSLLLTIAGALIWISTFQPLVKIAIGTTLGVGYSYAYLYGLEPRFKMRYGSYLAAPRWARVTLHLSGMAGSPLAAAIVWATARGAMPLASLICAILFWMLVATNLVQFIAGLAGLKRLGLPVRLGSGGAAGIELREALGR